MKNNSKYSLNIKGGLNKKDSKMIAKIYAYSIATALIVVSVATLITALGFAGVI